MMDWVLVLQIIILMLVASICITTTINSIAEKRVTTRRLDDSLRDKSNVQGRPIR